MDINEFTETELQYNYPALSYIFSKMAMYDNNYHRTFVVDPITNKSVMQNHKHIKKKTSYVSGEKYISKRSIDEIHGYFYHILKKDVDAPHWYKERNSIAPYNDFHDLLEPLAYELWCIAYKCDNIKKKPIQSDLIYDLTNLFVRAKSRILERPFEI